MNYDAIKAAERAASAMVGRNHELFQARIAYSLWSKQ